MNGEWLLRGSLILLIGYAFLALVTRLVRPQSTFVRQAACAIVLLAAWQPMRPIDWKIPWFAAESTPTVLPNENFAAEADLPLLSKRTSLAAETQTPSPQSQEPLASTTVATSTPFPPLRNALSFLWLLGVALLMLRGGVNYAIVLRRAAAVAPVESICQQEWDAVRRDAGVAVAIPLRITHSIGPMLGLLPGGFRLLLPAEYWSQLFPAERRTVLRHELAHYVRGDILTSFIFRLFALPFWFHPAAWRLIAWFEEAAEDACDRAAVRHGERTAFARALEQLLRHEPTISPTLGRCAQSHPLVARVRRVLNPIPYEDSLMKTSLIWAAAAIVAVGAGVRIQLVAQEPRDATIERVQDEQKKLEARLGELKSEMEKTKAEAGELKSRVDESLARIKALAAEPERWSEEAKKRIELMKTGDEAKQQAALDGSEGLKDERLILLGFAAKDGASEKVRRHALEIACTLGETGLPVIAHSFESLTPKERVAVVEQLAKAKYEFNPLLFARICKADDDQVRIAALTAGLATKRPLLFLALAADGNEGLGEAVLARTSFFEGDDLQSLLYAIAWKGQETLLPQTIRKAADLKAQGYPVIAAAYQRKTPESRAEIVRLFKKSTVPVEQRVVKEALADEDSTLREAAEKANAE